MIGRMDKRQADLLFKGLSPEPGEPVIHEVGIGVLDGMPEGVPEMEFSDGAVLTQWLCACPVPYRGERLAVRIMGALTDPARSEEARAVTPEMHPLGAGCIVAESWPDFTEAIDLKRLAEDEDGVHALFCATLRSDRERIVRLSHGAIGDGVTVHVFVNGLSVPHGGFVRLAEGVHVLVMQTCSGKAHYTWQWEERRAAPRFDEVTREDVRALYEWRHARWQRSADAADADEAAAVKEVEIDPDTIVGTAGFIRVGKSRAGMWWLLGPDGKPFYYRAMCSVNNRGGTGGRRKGDPALSPEQVRHWISIMQQWGFNGLGSWTTRDFFDKDMAFTEIIESFYEGPFLGADEYRYGIMPDVFDDRWIAAIDRKCRDLCTPLADSKLLIGYFIDNERGFHDTRVPEDVPGPIFRVGDIPEKRRVIVAAEPIENPEKLGLLQMVLSLDESRPAAQKGWEFIDERYGGDPAAVSKAWEVPVKSRLSFNEMALNGERMMSEGYLSDEADFIRIWVQQYFKVCTEAIRRYDPNHLIIGLRWAGTPSLSILEEEIKWSDVISMNRYRAHVAEAFDRVYRKLGRPILIGEFEPDNDSFLYVRDPIEPIGGYDSDWDRQQSRAYETIDRVSAHPAIVGYTYYAWKAGSRHPEDMRAVQRANWRSTHVRAERDRLLSNGGEQAEGSLTGQVFAILNGGRFGMALGLVCRDGTWDKCVYGHGIRGEITETGRAGDTISIALKYRSIPGVFTLEESRGACGLEFERMPTGDLVGTFEGTFDGRKHSGTVVAYVHRPLPDPRY